MNKTMVVLATTLALVACTQAPKTRSAMPAAQAMPALAVADTSDSAVRAKAAAADFSARLRSTLQDKMQSEGPVAAVGFCQAQAPRIADAVMAEHGVRLGRVALPGRNRNPLQTPQGWQAQTLARIQSAVDAGAAASDQLVVQCDDLPQGTALRMMRGITVEPQCLACHGRGVATPVAQAIARHYPQDAATGFDAGDLRGALWVEVPAVPASTESSGP